MIISIFKWTLFSLATLDSFSLAGDGTLFVAFATSLPEGESPKGSLIANQKNFFIVRMF